MRKYIIFFFFFSTQVQGMLPRDSLLYQIPYFTTTIVEECQKHNVEDEDGSQSSVDSVLDILDMEDNIREVCLKDVIGHMNEIAEFCNGYVLFLVVVGCCWLLVFCVF